MKRLATILLIMLFVGGAMAQIDPLGTLRQVHMRIAKQQTDTYVNALADTIETSAAFKDSTARKLFLDDFHTALGIGELANKPNAEELKKIKDNLIAGPWTNASKLAAWNSLKQTLIPEPGEPAVP